MLGSRFRISPGGSWVAVSISDKQTGTADIWIFEREGGVSARLHSDPVHEFMPVWTADGAGLIYSSDRNGPPDICEMTTAESPGSERILLQQEGFQQPEDASSDGRSLAYVSADRWPNTDIWLLPLQGERRPSAWARTRFVESSPRFSPDGRWIAYQSDESGVPEIYVALTQGGGGKRRISPSGGQYPRWRADGKELYYVGPGDLIMAVPVTPGVRLEAGAPVPLFRVDGMSNYDVTSDGSRLLVGSSSDPDRDSRVRVVVNWPAAMER
jgi:Tol biopolymer transport system component